ncbi:MAG TPA: hypothetical protein VFF59_04030, partial [Anaerolineae bacterium]|nr:hypothetical protein [Anaerolineae bacterium]
MDNPSGCPRAHPQAVGCTQAPQGATPFFKKGNKESASPFNALTHQTQVQAHNGGAPTAQTDPIPTIFPTQPSIRSKSVTFPKSPVTFAEIRIEKRHEQFKSVYEVAP